MQTYEANHVIDHPLFGDIRGITPDDLPAADVYVGGFPCQSFSVPGIVQRSILGQPSGTDDKERGDLFYEIVRLAAERRPRLMVLENVENLLVHNKRKTFQDMRRTLMHYGYDVQVRILPADGFVPQRRNRLFILAFLGRTTYNIYTWDPPARQQKLADILESDVPDKYTLSDKTWTRLQGKTNARGIFGYAVHGPDDIANTLTATYQKNPYQNLIAQPGKNPRRLTPRECSRLMGFDEPHGSDWVIPVSDSQAYKQFGNAVVVPLVSALAIEVIQYL